VGCCVVRIQKYENTQNKMCEINAHCARTEIFPAM
jgi:hypothetical protein